MRICIFLIFSVFKKILFRRKFMVFLFFHVSYFFQKLEGGKLPSIVLVKKKNPKVLGRSERYFFFKQNNKSHKIKPNFATKSSRISRQNQATKFPFAPAARKGPVTKCAFWHATERRVRGAKISRGVCDFKKIRACGALLLFLGVLRLWRFLKKFRACGALANMLHKMPRGDRILHATCNLQGGVRAAGWFSRLAFGFSLLAWLVPVIGETWRFNACLLPRCDGFQPSSTTTPSRRKRKKTAETRKIVERVGFYCFS